MSNNYNEYLHDHIENVNRALGWIKEYFPDIGEKLDADGIYEFMDHDTSKYGSKEYDAYDKWFYGTQSYANKIAFNYAWLHHIHNNPHHWQYWVLQHDDEPEEALEMPFRYVIEMICDWWSFSFKKGKLDEIFSWYEDHRGMKLHTKTRKLVEDILERIKEELEKEVETRADERSSV